MLREILTAADSNLSGVRDLTFVAEKILWHVNDPQWAARVYQKAEQAADARAYRHELILSIKNKLKDDGWAMRLYRM